MNSSWNNGTKKHFTVFVPIVQRPYAEKLGTYGAPGEGE